MRVLVFRVGVAIAAIIGSVGLMPVPAGAQMEDVDFEVEVRWRPETQRMQLTDGSAIKAFGGNQQGQQFLRTRVSALFAPNTSKTQARVDLQDARALGSPASGEVDNDANLGVHQAYLRITELFHPALQLQAGRFEVEYGNGRLLSGVSWSNTGRSFDGAKLTVVSENVTVDLLHAKLVERASSNLRHDTDLWALNASIPTASTDVFLLFDFDSRKVDSDRLLQRWTAGTYSARQVTPMIDYVVNGAYQFGKAFMPDAMAPGGLAQTDIAAFLATAELGFTPANTPARFAIGGDFASGDDPESESFNAFNNEYYDHHAFRGTMDQFTESNPEGLVDVYAKAVFEPAPAWSIEAAGHWLQTAQEFESAADPTVMAKSLGAEADLMVATRIVENAHLSVGGSLFFPSEDWKGPSPDMESWGYAQVTVNLD